MTPKKVRKKKGRILFQRGGGGFFSGGHNIYPCDQERVRDVCEVGQQEGGKLNP